MDCAKVKRVSLSWLGLGAIVALAACSTSAPTPPVGLAVSNTLELTDPSLSNGPTAGEEFFSAAQYGVSASPRVATGPRLKRGGGYEKVGSSYVVKGRRYHPTEDQPPSQTGRASWYGNAFHGRLTANGEIFDMNHLTAAHKTMPLPSYARVTNAANGHSVIVRVNDRGPFSNNRIIDVSKRASEVLGFTRAGTAQVKVEYLGRAPLHGEDDDYLVASIRTGGQTAPNVALASAAPTPAQQLQQQTAFPPVPERPFGFDRPKAGLVSAYAGWRVRSAFSPFDASSAPSTDWKR